MSIKEYHTGAISCRERFTLHGCVNSIEIGQEWSKEGENPSGLLRTLSPPDACCGGGGTYVLFVIM